MRVSVIVLFLGMNSVMMISRCVVTTINQVRHRAALLTDIGSACGELDREEAV